MDELPFQNRVWHLHVGVSSGADQPAHCYDVRHLPEDTGIVHVNKLILACAATANAARIPDEH